MSCIEQAILDHTKEKEDSALEALDLIKKLKAEITGLLMKPEDIQEILDHYRDLITKGLLDGEMGIKLVEDVRFNNDL